MSRQKGNPVLFVMYIPDSYVHLKQELRTPNEGINQKYLKNWTDVADKLCFVPKNLGLGLNFWPCSEVYFLSGCP